MSHLRPSCSGCGALRRIRVRTENPEKLWDAAPSSSPFIGASLIMRRARFRAYAAFPCRPTARDFRLGASSLDLPRSWGRSTPGSLPGSRCRRLAHRRQAGTRRWRAVVFHLGSASLTMRRYEMPARRALAASDRDTPRKLSSHRPGSRAAPRIYHCASRPGIVGTGAEDNLLGM